MIDTLRVQWPGVRWCQEFLDWLFQEYPTAGFSQRFYDANQPWEALNLEDKKLGQIGVKSNRRGVTLWAERSLPKYVHGDNCALLSASEALEAATAWVADVEGRFADWWLSKENHEQARVKRIDLCYQQQVASTSEVFPYIARALKASRVALYQLCVPTLDLHLTGVSYNQNKFEHARWYDKGVESGNERYLNVIRHEEQLRGGKAGWLLDVSGARAELSREVARDRMNERYQGWGETEVYDLAQLLQEHGTQGAAALGLVIQPEFETMYQQHLSRSVFYRIKAMAMEARRRVVPVNLRLPDDAWLEPMVL